MLELLQTLSKEAFAVYLVLKARVDEKPKKMGMTLMEVSRLANVGVNAANDALDELERKGLIRNESSKIFVGDSALHIPFTKANTDSERLRKVEVECQRLRTLLASYQKSSGIGQIASEYDRETIRKIEELFGRGLTSDEAYILGGLIEKFGPGRTLQAVSNNITTNNPMRAASGFLRAGAMGKGKKKEDDTDFTPGVNTLRIGN